MLIIGILMIKSTSQSTDVPLDSQYADLDNQIDIIQHVKIKTVNDVLYRGWPINLMSSKGMHLDQIIGRASNLQASTPWGPEFC